LRMYLRFGRWPLQTSSTDGLLSRKEPDQYLLRRCGRGRLDHELSIEFPFLHDPLLALNEQTISVSIKPAVAQGPFCLGWSAARTAHFLSWDLSDPRQAADIR
jgi:hypothetical protein